jgi:hypothetical protein
MSAAVQKGMSDSPPIATVKADMPQTAMSALPPKADMCSATAHVCFGPIADMFGLFDHLVGAGKHGRRNGKAEILGRFEIDDEFKLRWL